MISIRTVGFIFLVMITMAFSKEKKPSSDKMVSRFRKHVSFLASDQLQGRLTGSDGDSLAAEYIRSTLIKDGLTPLFDKGFERYRVTDKIIYGPDNKLIINDVSCKSETDFAPFAFSQNGSFTGTVVFVGYGFAINEDSLKWNDYAGVDVKGKVALILRSDPEIEKPASPFIKYNRDRDKVLEAKDHGAIGVLLVSGKLFDAEDKFESLVKGEQSVGIPAFHITRKLANLILQGKQVTVEELEKKLNETRKPKGFTTEVSLSGQSNVIQTTIPTRNVVMEIPGNDKILKDEFVILGAHFDHLGWGGPGSGSRVPDTVGVHHGADDNASGVAMVLELANRLSSSHKMLKRSVLVISFSGEEEGLLGSRWFADHSPIDLNKVNAMVNLDMVGRLNENSQVQISGVGTSEPLKKMIYTACDTLELKLSLSSEGYGPSDHSSFYGKNIPVLFLTTGAHLDYHTPSDTWDKINYPGMVKLSDLSFHLVSDLANEEKLVFKEAGPKSGSGRGTRRKGITLGIMPDYGGNVKNGLRADFVTAGKPAALGGMKKGDIITFINGKPVNNIQDYMFRLNQLKRGETISVEVLRDNQNIVLVVQL